VAPAKINRNWMIAIIFLIVAIGVTVFIAWSRYRPAKPIEILLPPEQEISGNISIKGAVTNPGIYQFSGSDTIGGLIQSAGSITATGKSDSLELNIPQTNVTATPQKININTAEVWLLEALPGIGPVKANAIVDYRQKNGLFRSIDELTKVQGITATLLEQIKTLITVAD